MGLSRMTARGRRKRKRRGEILLGALRAGAAAKRKPHGASPLGALLPGAPAKRRRGPLPGLGSVGRPSWKLVGLAGIAGVAATGVVVARKRRTQSDLPPDELRERLHERLAAVDRAAGPPG